MESLIDVYKKTGALHHACLFEGEREEILERLTTALEREINFPTKGNPDFWHGEFETFGIDDSRVLKEMQTRKPVMYGRKIFIVSAHSFTTEAQNSLLKVFEEPAVGTHFFIITQNSETILPTLRSRLMIISERSDLPEARIGSGVNIEEFLKSSKSDRLILLKDIIEEKDKNTALSFLNDLEIVLYKKTNRRFNRSLEEIIECKKYLNGRSPSVKMILEHVALIIPSIG